MSVKLISDAMKEESAVFGIKQVLKLAKTKKKQSVFVVKDVREETIKKLEDAKIKFDFLKTKEEVIKDLGLDFYCEVFSILQSVPSKEAK